MRLVWEFEEGGEKQREAARGKSRESSAVNIRFFIRVLREKGRGKLDLFEEKEDVCCVRQTM